MVFCFAMWWRVTKAFLNSSLEKSDFGGDLSIWLPQRLLSSPTYKSINFAFTLHRCSIVYCFSTHHLHCSFFLLVSLYAEWRGDPTNSNVNMISNEKWCYKVSGYFLLLVCTPSDVHHLELRRLVACRKDLTPY